MATLEELKRENAELENSELDPTPQPDEVEAIHDEVAQDEPELEESGAEPETEDEDAESVEPWLIQDSEEDNADKSSFSGNDIAAAKRNLRAKLEKKHNSEVDDLKAEIEKLKVQSQNAPSQTGIKTKPKREDFFDADDPDEAFIDALYEWKENIRKEDKAKAEKEAAQTKYQEELNNSLNSHYQRANDFIKKNNIAPEAFADSEAAFHKAIDEIMPNQGEAVANHLISLIGEGSEKVSHLIGINATKRRQLQDALRTDPTGMKAAVLVGKFESEISAVNKRKTKAPQPAARANNGSTMSATASATKFKRAYDKAKPGSETYRIKQDAKRAGVDTSNW